MRNRTRVLYVDDNQNSLEVRAMMLEEYDLDVVTETNVQDARRRLDEADIDCVLSDLDMPDQDGFDLLKHVRETHPDLPFILFTSHESEDVIERALDSGATDYFPKSMTNVSYRLLAHRIKKAVRFTEAEQVLTAEPDARAGETEPEVEIGVPQTEIDPANEKRQTDVDGWGWEGASVTENDETTETTASQPLMEKDREAITVADDDPVKTAEPSAKEREWETTSEIDDALRWLDSDERRIETGGPSVEFEREPDEMRGNADGFIYPESIETEAERSESAVESRAVSDGIEIVGTVEIEADTDESTVTEATGEPESDVAEPETVAPIPGIAPGSTADASRSTDDEKRGESDETPVRTIGSEETADDGETELAAKINLGSEPSTETSQTPPDEQPTPSVALGSEPVPDSALEIEREAETEATPEPEPEPDADPSAHDHDHMLLEGFDPQPGEGVLVECGSQDSRKGHACLDLLGIDSVEGRNVLLIRYRQIGAERLRRIAENAESVHLISIGYRQSIPDGIDDLVETTRISNPGELTRLGIVMTRVIGNWDESIETVVCLDSLDILMGYKDERSVFRFLHVLLSKLQSANAISHFHIEPSRGDDQGADTLKPLFDSIVTIDDDGVHIE